MITKIEILFIFSRGKTEQHNKEKERERAITILLYELTASDPSLLQHQKTALKPPRKKNPAANLNLSELRDRFSGFQTHNA